MSRFLISETKSITPFLEKEQLHIRTKKIIAHGIGHTLIQEIKKDYQAGNVISVFDKAINVRLTSGFMLSLLPVDYGIVPFGISFCTSEVTSFRLSIEIHDNVSVNEDFLYIGPLGVDLRKARIEKPICSIILQRYQLSRATANRAIVLNIIRARGIHPAKHPLITLLDDFVANDIMDELTVAIKLKVKLLQIGFLNQDISLSSRAIIDMLGIGYGSTPSADDIFLGFIAFFSLIKSEVFPQTFLEVVWKSVLERIPGKTTAISEQYLTHGLKGHFTEVLSNFIFQLVGDDPDTLRKATIKLLDIGSSSGLDMLIGGLLASGLNQNKMKS